MADNITMNVDQGQLEALMTKLKQVADGPKMKQAMLDAGIVAELGVKEALEDMVYSKPERGYRRRKGAGLFGATQATGKVDSDRNEIVTGVRSAKDYAVYIALGTGIHAKDGKGRSTPWVYQDEYGNFHWTVGQVPKPYMTQGIKNVQNKIMKVISDGLI
jgi:hypothetical protein